MSGRDTLGKVRGIGSGSGEHQRRLLPSTPPHCCTPLSSCASNFNSTSIFIRLLLPSRGDRIQTLTRISPPDWLDTATPRGHATKKRRSRHTFFLLLYPPFTSTCFLSPVLLPSTSCVLPFLIPSSSLPPFLPPFYLHPSLCPSSTSSCFSLRVPPCQSAVWATLPLLLSAWWTGAAGFWRSNLLTKTGLA